MPEIVYLTADEWGMRWARPPIAEKTPDKECYVHHTAGGQLSADGATAFRILNEYAINVKGYSAMDYDVVVHYNPITDVLTIGEGRGKHMSAATLDRNEEGEAVCVLGYFHPGHALSRVPYAAEVGGTALAIVWAMDHGWISRDAVILGHRDNPAHPGATGCPGDYLYAKLPEIRARVAALLTDPPEDDMAKIGIIRPRGIADQFALVPISSAEQARRMGLDGQQPVIVDVDRAALEAAVGYTLTPTANGN